MPSIILIDYVVSVAPIQPPAVTE